jgi:3-hydroxyacyl-[acyl-carrier-protein] dehydratase
LKLDWQFCEEGVSWVEINELMRILPHRYPFLLVDRVLEAEAGVRAVGIKNVTVNEPFFAGHFPGWPIMPGVLILEAMAQVAVAALAPLPEYQGKAGVFAGIEAARFRRPVVPGDQLRLELQILKRRGPLVRCQATATVDGEVAAEATFTFAITDAPAEAQFGAGGSLAEATGRVEAEA